MSSPACCARHMTFTCPAPPDWLTTAMSPAGRRAPRIDAVDVKAKASTKLTRPLQFGPMKRRPPARAMPIARCCRALPSSVPVSAKPAENTVANGAFTFTQSSSAWITLALGVYRIDLALEAEIDEQAHAAAAELAQILGGADESDAPRREKALQVREIRHSSGTWLRAAASAWNRP